MELQRIGYDWATNTGLISCESIEVGKTKEHHGRILRLKKIFKGKSLGTDFKKSIINKYSLVGLLDYFHEA